MVKGSSVTRKVFGASLTNPLTDPAINQRKESTKMKRLNLVYGDAMLIYCIGCVDREDTIARFEQIIPHVGNEEVRAQMFILKEKINQYFDDEDWAIFFPKVLRNLAVYLDRDRENFEKCLSEMREELKRLEQEERMGPKYGYRDDED